MLKNKFLFILSLLIISSCSTNIYQKETEEFKTYLVNKNVEIQNGIYVIIPLDICQYCVNDLISKINNMQDTHSLYVILSGMTSFNINERKKELKNLKIIDDTKMSFFSAVDFSNGLYPLIIKIKNEKIYKIIEVKTGENDKEVDEIITKKS